MATWKVVKEKIKLFPHPNADLMELGKVGTFQVVVQKGLYKDGDIVIFAPEKSILTGRIREEYEKYLSGTNKDRVKSVTLRGEMSCGIIIPNELIDVDLSGYGLDEDISELLGISKYIPPIPQQLAGQVKPIEIDQYSKHDVEQFGVYANEFDPEETILATEKLHGSQISIVYNVINKTKTVTSKGMADKGLEIIEDEKNSYWEACKNVGLWDILEKIETNGKQIQLFGEIIPIQKGFNYGQTQMVLKLFRVKFDEKELNLEMIKFVLPELYKLWAPILYIGPMKDAPLYTLKEGKEQVSGKELHIKEGICVSPLYPRKDSANKIWLILKLLNSKYKETGEEFN